jgi:hypothetical protein
MNRVVLIASAAAAVLVIAILGYNLLPRTGGIGGQATPSPTPSPTAAPTAAPAATSLPTDTAVATVPPPNREFEVGAPFALTVRVTLPADWVPSIQSASQFDFSRPASAYPYLGLFLVESVYLDPCRPGNGFAEDRSLGPYAPDLLSSDLRSLRGFARGLANTTTINGQSADHFYLSNDIDTSTAGCTNGDLLPLFVTQGGEDVSTNGGTTQEVWILSGVSTRHLLIIGDLGDNPAPGDQELIKAIVASLRV